MRAHHYQAGRLEIAALTAAACHPVFRGPSESAGCVDQGRHSRAEACWSRARAQVLAGRLMSNKSDALSSPCHPRDTDASTWKAIRVSDVSSRLSWD